jgi:hypothetical protein
MYSSEVYMRRAPDFFEIDELFRLQGKAQWFLQHTEDVLVQAIVLKYEIREPQSIKENAANDILATYRKMTLGRLAHVAKKEQLFPPDLLKRLDFLVAERNWLAHRMVNQNRDDMNVSSKRKILFRRLATLSEEAQRIANLIAEDLFCFCESKGIARHDIERRARRDLEKARGTAHVG